MVCHVDESLSFLIRFSNETEGSRVAAGLLRDGGGGIVGRLWCWWGLAEVSGWCGDGRALSCFPHVPVIEVQGFH